MSTYYSPLRYPGGKNCIFPFVSNLFYENRLIGSSYAEPYAGGAGLALRLLCAGYVEHIYINDLDKSIYAFWKTVIGKPDAFCEWLSDVDVSVEVWKKYKAVQKETDNVDLFELAKSTFFLNRTNVSGVITGGIIGGVNQKGKYKIDARFNKKDLISRIQRIRKIRDRISVSNFDGIQFIQQLDKKKEEIFIYLDPPYYQKGSDLYMNFYAKDDHEKLSLKVRELKKRWIVSYDNHEFILNLYAEEKKLVHRLSQSVSNRVGDEIFVFSKKLDFADSMKSLKQPKLIL